MNQQIVAFLASTALLLLSSIAEAQIYQPSNRTPIADKTLGTQVSATDTNQFKIDGGLTRGRTLFHSFQDFSVPTGGAVNFTNPVGNRDTIARVTGSLFSDINGRINSNGANFFLINPNGITFGPNAQLNVGKAFMASTANGINLVDASGRAIVFGTNPNSDAPLLTINPNVLFNVSSLMMGAGNGQIRNYGTLQTTNDSQYIGLIGGNISLNGGKIIAPGGRVDIGGINTNGEVRIDSEGLVFNGTNLIRSDVKIADRSSISVRANKTLNPVDPVFFPNAVSPGSSINISANQIDIVNSGDRFIPSTNNVHQALGGLDAGLEINSGVKTSKISNINLDATGNINIQKSAIFNLVRSGAEGIGGGIKIKGNNITVTDKSEISTTLARGATGRGGDIEIKALGNLSIWQPNYPDVQKSLVNSDVEIDAEARSESLIAASTYGRGNAGKITIAAQGDVVVSDNNTISSRIAATGSGNGGDIKINAKSLTVKNGGQIWTTAADSSNNRTNNSKNNTGNIDIKTTGDITIFGVDSSVLKGGGNDKTRLAIIGSRNLRKGDTGKITLDTPGKLSIVNRGAILNSIGGRNGDGKSGGIKLNTGEFLLSNLSEISGSLGIKRGESKGISGDIDITATGNITVDESLDRLIVKEFEGSKDTPSVIANSINGTATGPGGKITIKTPGKVTVGNHNGITSTVEPRGEGDPGGIKIEAGELLVYNEGQILTVASDIARGKRGNAGDIDITTTGNITVAGNQNPAVSLASLAPAARKQNGESFYAKIASSSFRNGDAGTININAGGTILLFNKGGIVTNCEKDCKSQTGRNSPGDIKIDSKQLKLDRGNISVNGTNKGGNIIISTQDAILMRGNSGIATNSLGEGNGGNITISTQDAVLMRGNSSVAANSKGGGDGGNITINSQFLLAVPTENSDIIASAVKGRGGKVEIDAQGIFGIQFRPQLTSNSDIIVSSEFGKSGTVEINTPGTDPVKNKGELPAATNDASNQISQACGVSQRDNKFYITGRGGLPPNASEPQESDALWEDARAVKTKLVTTEKPPQKFPLPAIGLVLEKNGRARLIAAQSVERVTGTRVVCPGK